MLCLTSNLHSERSSFLCSFLILARNSSSLSCSSSSRLASYSIWTLWYCSRSLPVLKVVLYSCQRGMDNPGIEPENPQALEQPWPLDHTCPSNNVRIYYIYTNFLKMTHYFLISDIDITLFFLYLTLSDHFLTLSHHFPTLSHHFLSMSHHFLVLSCQSWTLIISS